MSRTQKRISWPLCILNRVTGLMIVVCLLASSTPAAPETIVAVANQSIVSFAFWFRASGLTKMVSGPAIGQAQEKQEDRSARMASVKIYPGDVTVQLGEQVHFAAVGYDRDRAALGGLKFKWSVQDEERKTTARITQRGDFDAVAPGTFKVMVEGAGRTAQVTVTVRDGHKRPTDKDRPASSRPVSNRERPGKTASLKHGARKPSTANGVNNDNKQVKSETLATTETAKRRNSAEPASREFAHAGRSVAGRATTPPPPAAMPLPPIDGWNDGNYWSSSEPNNVIGDPPGSPLDDGAGSGNFQFSAPVLDLSGRSIKTPLTLAYNSRVWNKSGSQINFDIDHGWPAPGWSLGFGKIVFMGQYSGGMIADADGTRHAYDGTASVYSYGAYSSSYFSGHTADGTLTDYSSGFYATNGVYNSGYAWAQFSNGSTISYGAFGQGAVYPTSISDANGNYVTITYVNNSGPQIQTITDTLGRVISFSYDSNSLLTAITGPGISGGTRVLARLHYRQLSLNYSFSGLTPIVGNSYPWVIDGIYYPGTGNGYWLGDSDSYSSYGMIAKVLAQRGMGFSAASLNDQGTLTQGSMTRQQVYNYPLTPSDPGGSNLGDAPTYTSLTESWTRDGSNVDSATTNYEVHESATPRSITITYPNGTKSTQFSYNHPGQYDDGLVYLDETRDGAGNLLQSSQSTWEQGAYDSPRPNHVQKTDERGQITATAYTYGSVYNQLTAVSDYDSGGTALVRSIRTQYQNSTNYTSRHILNLPLTVETYASDNTTRVAYTAYQYDAQTLIDTPGVVGHYESSNPYAPQTWVDGYWDTYYDDNGYPYYIWTEGYWSTEYYAATDYRGNVTLITKYANAVDLTGAVSETHRYDITGNVVISSSSCCEQTSFVFTADTQYAYPQAKIRGSATDPYAQVTTSTTSDFNTGLVLSSTDPNGRTSQTSFDPATLRPASIVFPAGSHTDYVYDDATLTTTETTYLSSAEGGGTADKKVKLVNGAGQIRQEKALGTSSVWDVVDTSFNNMGQVSQQTRPYRSGDTAQWTTFTYDALGRSISVTGPDNSTTQTFYNEASRPSVASSSPGQTIRIQDSWGRERWGRNDAFGRLVEVVEPDPNGSGSVASNAMVTTYGYNTLGKLTSINQGSQVRSFKYDSLGRLQAQKLAEANATLNDAGAYVGGSGSWSEVLTYDDRSNPISRTDARGVKTVYSYNNDPLNRLQSVSWDTSNFGDTANPIVAAATISYSYRTKSSGSQLVDITQASSVSASGVSTDSYAYDSEGRVAAQTLTLSSRPSYLMVTDYSNDSLDRITDVRYPAEYGNGAQPRKVVHHDYDIASRFGGITVDGQSQASNISYNAASQTGSLSVGNGANQIVENYTYNAQTGLLDNQTVARGGTTLLNLAYDYVNSGGKRTGQLTKVSNNLDHNKDRGYGYDMLGRLQRATGGQNVNWVQRYGYDRFGNRTNIYSYTADQYVRSFYLATLNRQPNSTELQNWLGSLQTAYAQGTTQFFTAMQSLGETLFSSTEYANRNRNDHDYVYDLYKAYLARNPDSGGWAFWESQVPSTGRAAVRGGFAWSTEFSLNVSGTSPYSPPGGTVPPDGWTSMGIDSASNRVNSTGFQYDAAGNQVRVQAASGAFQRFRYDAANRLAQVLADDNTTVLSSSTYGCTNQRLISQESGVRTYSVWSGPAIIAEFIESGASTTPSWSKSYVYLGARLLSTLVPNGAGGEAFQHHHPDRLGTRVVSNPSDGSSFEQVTLPFGSALSAESTGATTRRFTSYDRSATTGLDYAVNRHYDALQGRFTQVDPAGMKATSLENPQTLNLYGYCVNDPINHTDPSGLGFFSFLKKLFKVILRVLLVAVIVAVLVVVCIVAPYVIPGILGQIVMWAAFVLAAAIVAEPIVMLFGHLNQWLHRCRAPDFAGLSQARQGELAQRGVTPEQWNHLPNANRLTYFNITAAIGAMGLSLAGWLVDWAKGGVQHERVFFKAGPGATDLLSQIRVSANFAPDINGGKEHADYRASYRESVFHRSLQMSFTPDGTHLDADLDSFNPNDVPFGLMLHALEVFGHKLGSLYGTHGTNPYNVAFRSSWECK